MSVTEKELIKQEGKQDLKQEGSCSSHSCSTDKEKAAKEEKLAEIKASEAKTAKVSQLAVTVEKKAKDKESHSCCG